MNFSRNAAQKWGAFNPSTDALQKIARYFEITVDDLLNIGKEDNKKTAIQTDDGNENEKEFIRLFLQLSPDEQMRELSYLRDVVNRKDM